LIVCYSTPCTAIGQGGIFIAPPVYLAELGKLNAVDTADLGGGMSVEKQPRRLVQYVQQP
tara:strand:- start:1053 stop:1232 length:180 start_codon:yes stop_codon:yes gene_type:complete